MDQTSVFSLEIHGKDGPTSLEWGEKKTVTIVRGGRKKSQGGGTRGLIRKTTAPRRRDHRARKSQKQ